MIIVAEIRVVLKMCVFRIFVLLVVMTLILSGVSLKCVLHCIFPLFINSNLFRLSFASLFLVQVKKHNEQPAKE
jgi:hypothetical protein